MSWEYDEVAFDSVVRRSGGSLVITIPPELKRRFMISEGQKVRLIGVVRRGLHVEGGILIYLGRFEISESAPKLTYTLRREVAVSDRDIKALTSVLDKYGLTNYYVKSVDDHTVRVEVVVSSISEDGIISLTKDDVKRVFNEIARMGWSVESVEESVEEVTWHGIDPSAVTRYVTEIPENIKTRWVLK